MTSHPKTAVVVVSYNTRDLLLECLASVFEGTPGARIQVVVVDNASKDGSYEAIRSAYPQVTTIRNTTNLGFGTACNQGIQVTTSPLILLLNSDARLTAPAFEALCDCLEHNDRCGAAGCRLIDSVGAQVINTRNFLTPVNQALEMAGVKLKSRRLSRTYLPNLDGDLVDCSVDWIEGACLMLRRAALDEVGLLDERFFMYSEDEDLCLRLRKNGWLVCFCGAGTAIHHGAASTRQSRADMLRHFYQSQMLFLSKHHGNRAMFLFTVAMKTTLLLKRWLPPGSRREAARQHLQALRESCGFKPSSAAV